MEKLVQELKDIIQFKDTTEVGDIILIVSEEPKFLSYAYVANITADTSRKDEWWNLDFTLLSIPQQKMTWTLRTPQMTGMEIFTMGGEERFVKAVDFGKVEKTSGTTNEEGKSKSAAFIKRVK